MRAACSVAFRGALAAWHSIASCSCRPCPHCGRAATRAFFSTSDVGSMSKNFAAGSSTGQIALRNIAQKSLAFSSSLSETSPRVQSLHRDVLRAVPWTKRTFSLPYTEQVIATRMASARPRVSGLTQKVKSA
eukprot:6196936-Pleurochrysis_carterae.AAC.2